MFGELSLGGELRDSPGALAVAEGAQQAGCARLIVPRSRAHEAALVEELQIVAVAQPAGRRRRAGGRRPAIPARGAARPRAAGSEPDLPDVRGHAAPLLALEIAAAGGHNLLLEGAPGTGKTMLARRLPTILPPLTRAEAIEVTRIHSVAGVHAGGLIAARPFRAPHHTISPAGLVGGGSPPRPGEATLAHHGVLFLDELSEFQRSSLDALRQPLEDGSVTIVRGQHALTFPTAFMLVAATNPCPCGFAGVEIAAPAARRTCAAIGGGSAGRCSIAWTCWSTCTVRPRRSWAPRRAASSAHVPARVARPASASAAGSRAPARPATARWTCAPVNALVRLDGAADAELHHAYADGWLSARGRHRVLRVARTIADLGGRERLSREDILLRSACASAPVAELAAVGRIELPRRHAACDLLCLRPHGWWRASPGTSTLSAADLRPAGLATMRISSNPSAASTATGSRANGRRLTAARTASEPRRPARDSVPVRPGLPGEAVGAGR